MTTYQTQNPNLDGIHHGKIFLKVQDGLVEIADDDLAGELKASGWIKDYVPPAPEPAPEPEPEKAVKATRPPVTNDDEGGDLGPNLAAGSAAPAAPKSNKRS